MREDRFDVDGYIDVATRIDRFYKKHPQGSIQTEMHHFGGGEVVFIARVFREPGDPLPVTGWAHERESAGYVNKTSFVENCETSAIGRALANLGFPVKEGEKRPSREEMAKVKRQAPAPTHEPPAPEPPAGAVGGPPPESEGTDDFLRRPCGFGKDKSRTWLDLLDLEARGADNGVSWAIANLKRLTDEQREILRGALAARKRPEGTPPWTEPEEDGLPF